MNRQKSFINDNAKLYLVSTPIGNLEDITFRAINTLKMVGVVFAEDTRVTRVLLNHYNIDKRIECYQEHNKEISYKTILDYLKKGISVALVSDAGMPVISDPGFFVSKMAVLEGFDVVPIPGANAALSGLIVSNITPLPFTFYGFLDSKTTKRKKELERLKEFNHTLIFYESPHRVRESLVDVLTVMGDRNIALCRELTKKFEEIIRGKCSEVIEVCESLKGEMVLVIEGANETSYDDSNLIEQIDELIVAGKRKNEAIGIVAKRLGLVRQDLYKQYIEAKDVSDE